MKRNLYIAGIAALITLAVFMVIKLAMTDIKFEFYNNGEVVCFKDKNCFKLEPIK